MPIQATMRAVTQSDLRRVAKCRKALDESRAQLREAIRVAVASGETYRDVARMAGISYQRVAQIVHEDDDGRGLISS